MKAIGLTGGVGMGKSTAARYLQTLGWCVVDTDLIARDLVMPGQPALGEIATALGPEVITDSGELNRKAVADLVFEDPQKRGRLERILHPRIRRTWLCEVDQMRARGEKAVIVVLPLLFETGSEVFLDATVCAGCSRQTQFDRLRAKGWRDREIEQRLGAQWPLDKKMLAADFVVWTEGRLETTHLQIRRVFLGVL